MIILINQLKNLKKKLIWYKIVNLIIYPIFNFFWKNIINFEGRVLYLLHHSKININSKYSINESMNDKIIIENDDIFLKLSNKIKSNIYKNNLIDKSNYELESNLVSKSNNKFKSGSNAYVNDIFDGLDNDLKQEIIKFSLSHEIYISASQYFGTVPVIAKINLLHNTINKQQKPRASMLWHKDDFGFKSLDLFLAISDISEANGPFEYVKQKCPIGVFYKIDSNLKQQETGQRNKIDSSQFKKYFKEESLGKFTGKSGTGILVDSFTVYHRGGNCLSDYRLMLRISYQTPDSHGLSKKNSRFLYKYINDNQIYANMVHKYSLSKRNFFNWSIPLLKFYRLFHYKA